MKYAFLIYGEESTAPEPGSTAEAAMHEGYMKFSQEVNESGAFQGGERLFPVASATTVRIRDGKTLTTDGPFAETREQLAGFYILDCKDLDQALGLAARLPGSALGSVEVRPVWEM